MSTPPALIADRYRLAKMLGAGGMGIVWQAWDTRLHRPVALKMLRTQPELSALDRQRATDRAMREARITAGLHHPHAVTVFDVIEHEGQPCIVMQLVDSTPLSDLLREHGSFTPSETARIGAEVASALAAAHALKIVHRDVKPGNILIAGDGSALISDFGISHALGDATITATGLIHGTPAYLAPEVARGLPTSFASDVFSLGATLYATVEGEPPFGTDSNPMALLHRVSRGGYPAPQRAGPLAPLLRKMLASHPKRRPTMLSVAQTLGALADEPRSTRAITEGLVTLGFDATTVAAATVVGYADEETEADETAAALHDETAVAPDDETAVAQDDETAVAPDEDSDASASPPTIALAPLAKTAPPAGEAVAGESATVALPTAETLPVPPSGRDGVPQETVRPSPAVAQSSPTAETEPLTGAPAGASLAGVAAAAGPAPARPAPHAAVPVSAGSAPARPAPASGDADAQPAPQQRERRSRAALIAGVLAAVTVAVIVVVLLFVSRPSNLPQEAEPAQTSPAASPSATPQPTPSPTPSPAPSEPEDEPESTPAPVTPPATVTPEQRVVDAITGYYAMMPDGRDSAWPLMTADYQQNHAGGRGGYEAFWSQISDVSFADVAATGPDSGQATVTYYFGDGRVVEEVTAYRLVDEGGTLKIAATEVLSSRTL